jgi:hypothetical protein
MNRKDKEFIREIVSTDFKQISNPDFTRQTLEKIEVLETTKINHSYSGDITFLIPVIAYVSLCIILSLIQSICSWPFLDQMNNTMRSIEMISGYFVHPVTISILFSFSLLYLFDLFLKKAHTSFTKPNTGS